METEFDVFFVEDNVIPLWHKCMLPRNGN